MFKKIPRFQLSLTYSDFFHLVKDSILGIRGDPEASIKGLEKALKDYIRARHAFVVPSARLGLKMILQGMNIGPGDEVIVPSWTYFAVPSILIFCKTKPVFVDIDPGTSNMDISSIKGAITKKTKAIIATHLYGLPMDMEAISSIANEHGLKIIEDCAQSFGATFDEKRTGSFGGAAFYSFGLTKNYTTINGGLVTVNDPGCAEVVSDEIKAFTPRKNLELLVKSIKGLVMKSGTSQTLFSIGVYPFLRLCQLLNKDIINLLFDEVPFQIESIPKKYFRSNINAVQAELGKSQLEVIDDANMLRHTNGLKLSLLLENQEKIRIVKNPEKSYNIYQSFPIQYKDRLGMIKYLLGKGIDTTEGFIRNCPTLPMFKDFYRECPNSERLEREILHIPVYPSLSDDKVQFIAESIREFLS